MRRIKYENGAVKVLVDIPEEMFQELKKKVPKKLMQSIAALAVQAINKSLEGETCGQ